MIHYNIAELFDIAFGIKGISVYNVGQLNTKPNDVNFNYSGLEIIQDPHEASRMSHLGTPIILPITLKGKMYQVFNELGEVALKQYESFELPTATLVTMRRNKIMTETNASASKGSVIEIYGFEAWQIDIRGFCLADPSHATAKTAYEQKLQLYEWDSVVDSIQVLSELFNDVDISQIAVKETNFNQLKGKPGVIPFYMRCRSDEPLELIL